MSNHSLIIGPFFTMHFMSLISMPYILVERKWRQKPAVCFKPVGTQLFFFPDPRR